MPKFLATFKKGDPKHFVLAHDFPDLFNLIESSPIGMQYELVKKEIDLTEGQIAKPLTKLKSHLAHTIRDQCTILENQNATIVSLYLREHPMHGHELVDVKLIPEPHTEAEAIDFGDEYFGPSLK